MKRCPACAQTCETTEDTCPKCGFHAAQINGVTAYAPKLAQSSDGFKPEYFRQLAKLEAQNFWFKGRNQLILWAIRKFCKQQRTYLEVGCGTGFVLSGIVGQNPDIQATGSEIFVDGLSIAAERVPSARFIQMDARDIPFVNEFDMIGAFDVIEHIEEDEQVLAQLHQALREGGKLLITVPQHKRLWSQADEYACHKRRYSAEELHRKVRAAGFEIERTTSFVTFLLPAMIASRFVGKKQSIEDFDETKELQLPPLLNAVFYAILRVELALIRLGIGFPIGGTRMLVARKS